MFASRLCAGFAFAAVLLLAGFDRAAAQQLLLGPQLPNASVAPETPAAPVSAVRAENAQHLQVALRKLEAGGGEGAAAHEVAFYQTREAVLAQQEAVEQQIKDLEARKADLEKQLKISVLAENPAAFTFAELDQLKDELAAEEARLNLVNDRLAATKAGVEKARAARDESETKRRQAQAERDAAKGTPNHTELTVAADQARLNAQLAMDQWTLRMRELDRDTLTLEVQSLLVNVHKDSVTRMSPFVVMSKSDYQQQLDDIKAKEDTANERLRIVQTYLQNVNKTLREAQEQFNAATGDRTIAAETLEAERRAREKLTDEIDCLTQRLQRLAQLRLAWNDRYTLSKAKTADPDRELWERLKSLKKETKGILGGLAEDLRMEILRMRDLRSSLTGVTKKLEAAEKGPEALRQALDRQHSKLDLTLRIHERNLVMIETSRRVHEKLLDEIGMGVETLSPKNLAYGAWHRAEMVWNFELASINREYPITVKTVVQGLALLMGGWVLARFLSTLFAIAC